jgi:ABC-type lipoprotein release transport system permease subunit
MNTTAAPASDGGATPARGGRSGVRSPAALAVRLARQWWPQLAALAAASGVVATTIAGAVGVGDAMQRGLKRLAVARLGGIDSAVVADGFFRAELAAETEARLRAGGDPTRLLPAIVLEASLEAVGPGGRAGPPLRATLLGCDEPQGLGFAAAPAGVGADEVAINGPLAASLGVRAGDSVVLRVTKPGEVPGDSPLGRRTSDSFSRRLRVVEVLPAKGIGLFSLRPAQVTSGLAVTRLATVQALMRRDAAFANVVLAVRDGPAAAQPPAARTGTAAAVAAALRPTLDDLGLSFERPRNAAAWRLGSRTLLLPREVDRAAEAVLGPLGGRPSLVFLANSIAPAAVAAEGRVAIPYSTVVGVDATALPVGDLVDDAGASLVLPGPDEVLVDRWVADDLAARGAPVATGTPLEIRFFEPETLHGRVAETTRTLRVSGIAAMRGAAVAREFVPEVEGITDEASIADWDPPFPFDRSRVRAAPPHDEDDRYWKDYGAAPKAFVSLDTARRLAGSRFGASTAWHVPAAAVVEPAGVAAALAAAIDPERLGMRVLPVRAQAEAAARGSTPFGSLFLALSSFLVGAGLMLEWLLFSLLVAARRRDVGILAAVGWPAGRVARLLAGIGAAAALAGVVVGTALGPLWTSTLLSRLATAWNTGVSRGSVDAFGDAGDSVGATLSAILPAAAAAAAVSLAAVTLAAWRAARLPPLPLLKGIDAADFAAAGPAGLLARLAAIAGPAAALGLAWWGRQSDSQAAIGIFFASGFAALVGLLAAVRLLVAPAPPGRRQPLRSLAGLAWRSLSRGRSRAFSVAAIVACAEFLIVAVSAFGLHPPRRPDDREAPTGGWTFIATFAAPSGVDPADPEARDSLGLSSDEQDALSRCTVTRIRSSAGDDASCMNLYAAARPTVLGLGPSFIDRGGFRFVDHAPLDAAAGDAANPWTLLGPRPVPAGATGPTPVILDQATAQWALKLGGVGSRFELDAEGGRVPCEIVGLLEPGILQGYVLVGEAEFQRIFPRLSGYSLALVDAGGSGADAATVARAVARAWSDAGPAVVPTVERLRSLQAVQNTFLAGFQALGTLGLVLGTAGVAAVQVQSVLERRGSLGLLQALGFTGFRIRSLVVLETLLMVLLGLAAGTLAGCVALVPALASGRAAVPAGWIAVTWLLTLFAALAAGGLAAGTATRMQPARALAKPD